MAGGNIGLAHPKSDVTGDIQAQMSLTALQPHSLVLDKWIHQPQGARPAEGVAAPQQISHQVGK